MDKSKSMKKAIIALLIFGLIAVVCWAVFFVVFALNDKILVPHFAQLLVMFIPWKLDMAHYLPNSIAVLGIALLLVAALVLMLVFSISKRRGIIVLPFFLLLVSGLATMEFAANFSNYTLQNDSQATGYVYYLLSNEPQMSSKIMAVAVMACAFIAIVISLVAFIFAMIHACKYKKTGKKEIEQPEEDPEVVLDAEPVPTFQEEPVPEEEKPHVDDEKELMDKIRELIREEIRAAQQPSQPAVSFSAPLIVQYFNGMGPAAPAPQPEPKKEEPKPEPQPEPEPVVEEEPVQEPEPEPEPVAEPEPAPVVEEPVPEPVIEPEPEKAKIIRIPFQERITSADKEMKDNYNELKNDILAYGVKSRVSNSGDTFRLHRKTYVKLTIAGKSLKLYFALNPEDYKDSTIPVADASEKNIYQEIPLIFKVKSGLSMRRAKQLIADVMAPDGLVQGEVGKVNWVKEIAAEMKEGKKAEKDEDED